MELWKINYVLRFLSLWKTSVRMEWVVSYCHVLGLVTINNAYHFNLEIFKKIWHIRDWIQFSSRRLIDVHVSCLTVGSSYKGQWFHADTNCQYYAWTIFQVAKFDPCFEFKSMSALLCDVTQSASRLIACPGHGTKLDGLSVFDWFSVKS